MAVVLAALTLSADQFAETVLGIDELAWYRNGRRAGTLVSALDLVREAVHEGSHHLRLATETLTVLRSASSTI
jgi:hypothetical protein